MSVERRRHRLFVTRHTEYHLRQEQCVGVRNRESGAWFRRHAALRAYALYVPPADDSDQWLGQRLMFARGGDTITTSPIVSIERPVLAVLPHYVSHVFAGMLTTRGPRTESLLGRVDPS